MVLVFQNAERTAAERLIELALAEDLGEGGDLTSQALIGSVQQADVQVVSREPGVLAGSPVAEMVFATLDSAVTWTPNLADGAAVEDGTVVATVTGTARSVLSGERTALNFLAHLSGIATLTRQYVDAVADTGAKILDTRKTLPGWRILEKYAVRCGGGTNHRMGLYDGVLIKDNHLAAWTQRKQHRAESGRIDSRRAEPRQAPGGTVNDPAPHGARLSGSICDAVRKARASVPTDIPIEIEVDTLDQLEQALSAAPDIILLDNMDLQTLRAAVAIRNRIRPETELEASGGISLDTVREIAETGVERISVGALTHSAPALDLAFDWKGPDA